MQAVGRALVRNSLDRTACRWVPSSILTGPSASLRHLHPLHTTSRQLNMLQGYELAYVEFYEFLVRFYLKAIISIHVTLSMRNVCG